MTPSEYIGLTKFFATLDLGEEYKYIHDIWNSINLDFGIDLYCYEGYTRECELISINKSTYICLDVKLVKTLSALNYLYKNTKNKDDPFYYGFIVLVDYLASDSYLDASIILKNWVNHRIEDKEFCAPENRKIDDVLRTQMLFIFYHELAHEIISRKDYKEIYAQGKRDVLKMYKTLGYGRHGKISFNKEELHDEIKNDFAESFGLNSSQINFRDDELDLKKQTEVIDKIIHDDEFIDEIFCDDLAFEFLIDHEEYDNSIFFSSVLKALNSISYMSTIESISRLERDYTISNDFYHRSTLRQDIFCKKHIGKLGFDKSTEEMVDDLRDKLFRRLNNQVVNKMSYILQEMKHKIDIDNKSLSFEEIKNKFELLKSIR